MICGSCRRRCDPNRSFCTNCGSSVFVDEGSEAAFSASPVTRSSSVSATPRSLRELQRSAKSFDRTAIATGAKALRAARAAQAAAAPSLRLGPPIRLLIFIGLAWYVGSWLLKIPEVLLLKDRVQAGHFTDEDLQAARDAIGARIQTFLRNAQDPNPPAPPARSTQVERTPAAPAPRTERPRALVFPASAAARLPPGASRPGNGVTLPRVLEWVRAQYTPEALRANIEGTVVLQAVVRTDGEAGDISVVRSLDSRFGLDQQAIAAVRQWRFAPGQRMGQPVPVFVQIEIVFSTR
jgi:TonB family protein